MKKEDRNKNKSIILTIITLIILVISIGIGIKTFIYLSKQNNKPNVDVLEKEKNKTKEDFTILELAKPIEYMTTWSYQEFINNLTMGENKNIEIVIDNALISDTYTFNKVGDVSVTLTSETIQHDVTLTVKDTIFPVINGIKDKTINVGDKIDLLSGISATDEVEGEIQVKTDSTIDTKKKGTYTIVVYAVDSNGNKTEGTYKVVVKAKTSSGNSSSTTTPTGCVFTNTLKKRGYKSSDHDACKKDAEASAIAKQIANEILSKGYATDLEKVEAAASAVASNYDPLKHVEEGFDYRTAYGVFVTHSASCAGCTRALLLVLEYMGFKNMTHANENGYTHQWVILEMDGQKGFADGQVGMVGYGCHPVDDDPSCYE